MRRVLIRSLAPLLISIPAFAQYKASPAGPPPPGIAPAVAQVLGKTGFQISGASGPYCEIWFRTSLASGPPTSEQNVTLPTVPVGALLGVIRFDGDGADRRGQTIKAGVYTLRYAIMPTSGNHEGAAPQRDFVLLVPAADDPNPGSLPKFDDLLNMSRKASRTPHPAVMSIWKADMDAPGFSQQGDTDWVLETKIGDTPIAIILVGAVSS